jgi:hypothetical protein
MARQHWPEFKKQNTLEILSSVVLTKLHDLGLPMMRAWTVKTGCVRVQIMGSGGPYHVMFSRYDITALHGILTGPAPPRTAADASDVVVMFGTKAKPRRSDATKDPFWSAPESTNRPSGDDIS